MRIRHTPEARPAVPRQGSAAPRARLDAEPAAHRAPERERSGPGSGSPCGLAILWRRSASQAVEVPCRDRYVEHLEIQEELVLVIDEMLQVSEEKGQDRLSFGDKDGRHLVRKLLVPENRESFFDVGEVGGYPLAGLLGIAAMVDGEAPEVEQVGQAVGVDAMEDGAEAGEALKDVPQENAEVKGRTGKTGSPGQLLP